jgi:hypothetical protein
MHICCQNENESFDVKSLFVTVVLNYYDGPTGGIMQCRSCSAVYRFIMVDWDEQRSVRIHALAPLPSNSFAEVVDLLSKYEPPKWPMWSPVLQDLSGEIFDSLQSQLQKILQLAKPATLVMGLSQWGDRILATRRLTREESSSVQDWFSLGHPNADPDWFSFLALARH